MKLQGLEVCKFISDLDISIDSFFLQVFSSQQNRSLFLNQYLQSLQQVPQMNGTQTNGTPTPGTEINQAELEQSLSILIKFIAFLTNERL